MKNTLSAFAFSLLATLPLSGCATSYSAKAIQATIVDAETAQPIAGVIVVATWVLEYGYEGGSADTWVVMETVSDAEGRFTFPSWGPKPLPPHLPWEARLKKRDPLVRFYKYGYAGITQTQEQADKSYLRSKDSAFHGATQREWYLNGETFLYKPAKGDLKALGDALTAFDNWLGDFRGVCASCCKSRVA